MAEAGLVSIEELYQEMDSICSAMESRLLCDVCGFERLWTITDCKMCEVMTSNVALLEEVREARQEVNEVRGELAETRKQLVEVRKQLTEVRREASVKSKSGTSGQRSGADEYPREGKEGNWRTVRGDKKVKVNPPVCEVSNRYNLLADLEEEEVVIEVGEGEGDRTPTVESVRGKVAMRGREDKNRRKGSQEVLILGDSRVRYLDRTFCEADRGKRMTCCLPGAGVQDVVKRVRGVVKGTGKEALVVVHVGVNDIGRVGSEELFIRYKDLLRELKESGRRCIVSGVLPRQRVGSLWHSHALGLNDRIKKLCKEGGVGFIDEWDRFYGRQELYAMDGVHFSRKGVQELSECLERAVKQNQGN